MGKAGYISSTVGSKTQSRKDTRRFRVLGLWGLGFRKESKKDLSRVSEVGKNTEKSFVNLRSIRRKAVQHHHLLRVELHAARSVGFRQTDSGTLARNEGLAGFGSCIYRGGDN